MSKTEDPKIKPLKTVIHEHVVNSLISCKWNKTKTAKALQISRSRLGRYLEGMLVDKEGSL